MKLGPAYYLFSSVSSLTLYTSVISLKDEHAYKDA